MVMVGALSRLRGVDCLLSSLSTLGSAMFSQVKC